MNALHAPQTLVAEALDERLLAGDWIALMTAARGGKFSAQAFRKACRAPEMVQEGAQLRQAFRMSALPVAYRAELQELRERHLAANFATLLDMVRVETRHAARARDVRPFSEYPPTAQARALLRMEVMAVYFAARETGFSEVQCNERAQARWKEVFGPGAAQKVDRKVCFKKVQRLKTEIDAMGGPLAPKEAYLDGKSCKHANAVRELPAALVKDFRARLTDSSHGVPSVPGVLRDYQALWDRGMEVPGLGCRDGDEPLPLTVETLRRQVPPRASRELSGRGKFSARVKGLLAAPPLDWSQVEPMRVVMFDDKTLDIMVKTDDGLRAFRPVIYIAYCAGTGRVLNFVTREEGRMTQLDVEALQAAVLRDHGFGGPTAGWVSKWIMERGTVSISQGRREFLMRTFPGYLDISRTSMIGGRTSGGDWSQAGKGNFFGKGRIEAFMWALDNLAHTLPAQTGNEYGQQPAMLGDTTLTLQKIINAAKNPKNRPARSLIEESILVGAMNRLLAYVETGENLSACEAARRTGIRPPMLYFSDFVAMLGEVFRRHNNRRGHAMQGFAKIRVPHPVTGKDGGMMMVTESPNDKAARMFGEMELQGRSLARPAEADIAMLLHKVKRVVVKANGCQTDELRYWHPESSAQREAASIMGGQKTFLALYNPIAPDALYLLANPPAHLSASATELPQNFRPQLFEVLPRYVAPSPVDEPALAVRRESVAAFNAKFMRAAVVAQEPLLLARTGDREELRDRLAPLRTTIMGARPPVAPGELPASELSREMSAAEAAVVLAEESFVSRIAARDPAAAELARFQAEHAAEDKETRGQGDMEKEPEIV